MANVAAYYKTKWHGVARMSEKENKKKPTRQNKALQTLTWHGMASPQKTSLSQTVLWFSTSLEQLADLEAHFMGTHQSSLIKEPVNQRHKQNIGFATMFLTKASKNADEKEKREWLRNRADHASHDVRKKLSYPMKQKETALTDKEKRSVGKNSEAS